MELIDDVSLIYSYSTSISTPILMTNINNNSLCSWNKDAKKIYKQWNNLDLFYLCSKLKGNTTNDDNTDSNDYIFLNDTNVIVIILLLSFILMA